MRVFLVAAIALLAGLIIGAWPYRKDLRDAREEIARLNSEAARRQRSKSNIEGITRLLAIPDRDQASQSSPAGRPDTGSRPSFSSAASNGAPASAAAPAVLRRQDGRPASPEDFRSHIRQAADLWKTRVALARESFVSRVPTNDAQAVRFDVLMEAMNIRLGATIEKWVDTINTQDVVTAETGVRMMNELTDAIVVTYDELDRNMPPDWREKAGPEFQLLDFVDPEVAMPLAEIAPKFERQDPFRPGPHTNLPPSAVEKTR